MSLLIKALEHLEKNKLAEKDKKQAGDSVTNDSLSLELIPEEIKPISDVPLVTKSTFDEFTKKANTDETELYKELSLQEEAGLISTPFVNSKHSKVKSNTTNSGSVNKATTETRPLKIALQDAPKPKNEKNNTISSAATLIPTFQNKSEDSNQKTAAKVFIANKEINTTSSKLTLITLGVVGALLVWLSMQAYQYIRILIAPELEKPVLSIQLKTSNPQSEQATAVVANEATTVPPSKNQASIEALNVAFENKDNTALVKKELTKKSTQNEKNRKVENIKTKINEPNDELGSFELSENNSENSIKTKRVPLYLVTKAQSPSVDPTLMSAYQAFVKGEDTYAQQQYRQVLQRDSQNIDALLGMGAIAQRQGRDSDSLGWYQKVLELDPKNPIALSASLNPQGNFDDVNTESRIKSMLSQQPEDANLHAVLGNLYAKQNQWPSAQESYFNASRLAPNNADYQFNLAVSLDHMGKSSVALKYYQRSLDLLNRSGGLSPDKAELEARIREIQ